MKPTSHGSQKELHFKPHFTPIPSFLCGNVTRSYINRKETACSRLIRQGCLSYRLGLSNSVCSL
ncbi:hypothetical protein PISMIDRAFT_678941 [Pisolithus microcarpus 441]|uniref:Unplaced genomic scaffold scaffold_39, whole genome shotgun sequence n=1 Tax=Pisolithus microcarpus 441 TaxID=765257 RepID=A0A0C9YFP5_9AGAM|nr:hypothetical protein PISMIDRAFT_678941 [Pisolithus microcarpus 441]